MHLSDKVTGSFLVVLGGVAAFAGSRLPPVPGQPVGPNVFPLVVGIGLVACGLLIALGIGRSFEAEPVTDAGADAASPADTPARRNGLWVLLPPALLLFYVFASERLGFIPTAALIIFIAALGLGASLRIAVPVALLAPFGVHLIFAKLLRVPLPPGLLPLPW